MTAPTARLTVDRTTTPSSVADLLTTIAARRPAEILAYQTLAPRIDFPPGTPSYLVITADPAEARSIQNLLYAALADDPSERPAFAGIRPQRGLYRATRDGADLHLEAYTEGELRRRIQTDGSVIWRDVLRRAVALYPSPGPSRFRALADLWSADRCAAWWLGLAGVSIGETSRGPQFYGSPVIRSLNRNLGGDGAPWWNTLLAALAVLHAEVYLGGGEVPAGAMTPDLERLAGMTLADLGITDPRPLPPPPLEQSLAILDRVQEAWNDAFHRLAARGVKPRRIGVDQAVPANSDLRRFLESPERAGPPPPEPHPPEPGRESAGVGL
jgi:hypothetical protein